ncbi:hypothetical protein VP01_9317g1 [Puccinia sorghi]|uniref:Tet-like 2OG-Fe(II) oxygenase domain-containing protein n=1 Tax=Puccinia sorghi TaxID=27349 RepID=A0A0L6U700_9BASI|nr:hypothetical protein VP01_9317g1 [Puccinia sorghi]
MLLYQGLFINKLKRIWLMKPTRHQQEEKEEKNKKAKSNASPTHPLRAALDESSQDEIPEKPGFTCHLSFTIANFSKKPHKDNDASPFKFFMWIPIKQTTGNFVEENFEVKGGEFLFSDDSCSIKFSGFNGIVECAWKATAYSHMTLPSNTPSKSLYSHGAISPP